MTVDEDAAMTHARAADQALARGEPSGPLCGLSMTVKDTLETARLRTTAGAPGLAGHVPDRDADAVARLRAAGAVIFGKPNTPPFAGDYQTTNPLFGRTTNPWHGAELPAARPEDQRSLRGGVRGHRTAISSGTPPHLP